MDVPRAFASPYSQGFLRVAVCVPHLRVADPGFNGSRTAALARRASDDAAAVALFPELGLSAYSSDDLLHQDALLGGVRDAITQLVDASRELAPVLIVGAPLVTTARLFNCAVVIHAGRVLGVVPKTYLPNYREFYEKRHFTSARDTVATTIEVAGTHVPFGNDLLFRARGVADFVLHVEVCEDLWVPIPPSSYAALAGATVLANLSASNATVGKYEYRHSLCGLQSARCIAAYAYAAAGFGESTTDLAWDGHAMIYENGVRLAESARFAPDEQLIVADVDLDRLRQERMRMTSFNDNAGDVRDRLLFMRTVEFDFAVPAGATELRRAVSRFPYVPEDPSVRDARCAEVVDIQVQGLAKRLVSTEVTRMVIGISGGLDSSHALLIAASTMDRLRLPRANILAYTMPGFATSDRSRGYADALMRALGVTAGEIDIRPSAMRMFEDIGHPFARGEAQYDVTFENVQAGERTSHLFRLANLHGALVVGTSDLSELALGWTTYGVGDQMSHYAVNASVPKSLIQYLIRWEVATRRFGDDAGRVLQDIVNAEITPELIPAGAPGATQRSEDVVGPFALVDFFLYYTSRYGYRPGKVAYLAWQAWGDAGRGAWPSDLPLSERRAYTAAEIVHWLEIFADRFFRTSQFKRSAMPNAPKVGSGGSLSPRGDWRAPSDAESRVWLDELRRLADALPAGGG
jgi:NAD+ synthase (glutamine-hydrolysing)